MKRGAALALALLLAPGLRAEVFTLRPLRDGGNGGRAAGFDELVPGVEQRGEHRESLLFNGLRLEMTVSRISTPFDELVRHLSVQLKPEELIRSGGTLRVSRPLGGGRMERYLLIDSGPGKPVTAFRVVTPEKLPKPPRWPSGLPRLPVGAEPVQVIEFCRTGNLYGSFRAASGEPAELLRSTAAGLRAAGWIPAAGEAAPEISGRGDLFLDTANRRIAWVNFAPGGIGSFYVGTY